MRPISLSFQKQLVFISTNGLKINSINPQSPQLSRQLTETSRIERLKESSNNSCCLEEQIAVIVFNVKGKWYRPHCRWKRNGIRLASFKPTVSRTTHFMLQVKMSSLMHLVVENYNELLESKKGTIIPPRSLVLLLICWRVLDPLVDSWLFMQSPVPVTTILVIYLYFVLKLGPQLMKNREAFNLKYVMIAYNAYQVLFSTWLCAQAFKVKNAVPYLLNHTCKNPAPNKEFQDAVS